MFAPNVGTFYFLSSFFLYINHIAIPISIEGFNFNYTQFTIILDAVPRTHPPLSGQTRTEGNPEVESYRPAKAKGTENELRFNE